MERVGVWYWPGAALLAMEEEEDEDEGDEEEEETEWFSYLLWDALIDGPASDLWTEHHSILTEGWMADVGTACAEKY